MVRGLNSGPPLSLNDHSFLQLFVMSFSPMLSPRGLPLERGTGEGVGS